MSEEQKQDNDFNEDENFFSASENAKPDNSSPNDTTELPYTYVLKFPIKVGDKVYNEVVFKYPLRGEFIDHIPILPEHQKNGHYYPSIAGMCGIPTEVINKMVRYDLIHCLSFIQNF